MGARDTYKYTQRGTQMQTRAHTQTCVHKTYTQTQGQHTVGTHVHTGINMHRYAHGHTQLQRRAHVQTRMHTHINVCSCTQTQDVHTCRYVCARMISMHTCAHWHVHTRAHKCMHTHARLPAFPPGRGPCPLSSVSPGQLTPSPPRPPPEAGPPGDCLLSSSARRPALGAREWPPPWPRFGSCCS